MVSPRLRSDLAHGSTLFSELKPSGSLTRTCTWYLLSRLVSLWIENVSV